MRIPHTANRAKTLQVPKRVIAEQLHLSTGGTAPWSPQRIDYKRKPRDTWTLYEVDKPLGFLVLGKRRADFKVQP